MSDYPRYQGKAIAYLDQNILDIFVKYGMIDFAYALKDNYQVVYSDETLKEIKRSGEYADKFLDVLSKLEAFHIKQRVTASFELTDEVTISKRDTYVAYNEYCEQEPVYEELLHSMMQNLFKTHGGRKGDEFEVLKNEQLDTFSNLMGHLNEQAEIIKEVSPILADSINDLTTLSMKQMETTLEESTALMSSSIDDKKDWSGVKVFRDVMNLVQRNLTIYRHQMFLSKYGNCIRSKMNTKI